jgi:S-disulfanyl-L-cysteine oxidoreductase SoxD
VNTNLPNIRARRIRVVAGGVLALALVGGVAWFAIAWAAADRPPEAPDYQGYNLKRPWFDHQYWEWFNDMVNQPSLKPQEVGTFQNFPRDSVPRQGVEPYLADDAKAGGQIAREVLPKNPVPATPESIAHGKQIFEIYCAACHGVNGMGATPVTQKGIPPIPMAVMVPGLSEAHIYNKALYGGAIMPSYGFQTSAKDRWDIVNYTKSANFGK